MNLKFGIPDTQLKDRIKDVDINCTSEEEALGICAGCILCGEEPIFYTQNSGFLRCLDIITSLFIPYDIPFPHTLLSIRHQPKHHEACGKITKKIIDLLGYYRIEIIEEKC